MHISTQDYEALERELSAEISGMEGTYQTYVAYIHFAWLLTFRGVCMYVET